MNDTAPRSATATTVSAAATHGDDLAHHRLVSNAHGALERVLLCFPPEAATTAGYRRPFADLLTALPPTTELTILVRPANAPDLQSMLDIAARTGTTVVETPQDCDFSIWARDPILAVTDADGRPGLLEPAVFTRRMDHKIADLLAERFGFFVRPTEMRFEGGNILVGDDFVLAGVDRFDNADDLDPGRRIITVQTEVPLPERELRPADDGRVEVLYDTVGVAQPLNHLDMFISLAGRGPSGRYRVLVGSPDLADRLLGRPTIPHGLGAAFDDVARQLEVEGFDVYRNPLPLTYGDGRRRVHGEITDIRLWYFASANNCLVQIDEAAGNHVWLPTYGHHDWPELAVTDRANRDLWKDLGFIVHELGSFHTLIQRRGSLRCIVNDLARVEANSARNVDW